MSTRPHDQHCADCDLEEFSGVRYGSLHLREQAPLTIAEPLSPPPAYTDPRRHIGMARAAGAVLGGDGRDPAVVEAERERGRSR